MVRKNADVVTTIIVLEKRYNNEKPTTEFWLWKKSLEQLVEDVDAENTLVNSVLLNTELNRDISRLSQYTQKQIEAILSLDVCYNALFHNVDWLLDIKIKSFLSIKYIVCSVEAVEVGILYSILKAASIK